MVRTDQLVAVRRSVLAAIPINVALSLTVGFVAFNSPWAVEGLRWMLLALAVNFFRIFMCRRAFAPPSGVTVDDDVLTSVEGHSVDWHLRLSVLLAGTSGCVWALIPLLCDGYQAPQTLFYLTVVCGICAGSVIYGTAYALVSISFVTPALLSVAGCLIHAGGFDRVALAAMVILYFYALVRGARQSEATFRHASRLKNEATTMASLLREAHQRSEAASQELAFRAAHDSLTGLLNREGFIAATDQALLATPGAERCLLLLDLDGFKAVNDAFGHGTGDRVLQDVGRWLRHRLQDLPAILGRWGGDEFVVSINVGAAAPSPTAIAQNLIASIPEATAHYGGHLGVSIGIATSIDASMLDLISLADEALYEAKRAGRNRYKFVDDGLNQRLALRRDIERDLMDAIEAREIKMWYQPIVRTDDGRVHGLEALLRWQHPRHGPISPEQVVFAAASTGIAEALLKHILSEICQDIQLIDRLAAPAMRVPISMNVSPREMAQLAVDDICLEKLAAEGIAPHRLHIEVTEEVALNVQATQARLTHLAAAGVAIVVDDFGTGYSSLATLRSAYVSQVKIDRSFTADILNSAGSLVIVEATVKIAQSLGLQVVAEGIESAEQLAVIRSIGCGLVQGYYLAKPAPLADVIARFAQAAGDPRL